MCTLFQSFNFVSLDFRNDFAIRSSTPLKNFGAESSKHRTISFRHWCERAHQFSVLNGFSLCSIFATPQLFHSTSEIKRFENEFDEINFRHICWRLFSICHRWQLTNDNSKAIFKTMWGIVCVCMCVLRSHLKLESAAYFQAYNSSIFTIRFKCVCAVFSWNFL